MKMLRISTFCLARNWELATNLHVTPQLMLEGNSPLKWPGLAVVLSGNFPSSKAAEKFILRRILKM
jgi:hypothetical protein